MSHIPSELMHSHARLLSMLAAHPSFTRVSATCRHQSRHLSAGSQELPAALIHCALAPSRDVEDHSARTLPESVTFPARLLPISCLIERGSVTVPFAGSASDRGLPLDAAARRGIDQQLPISPAMGVQ